MVATTAAAPGPTESTSELATSPSAGSVITLPTGDRVVLPQDLDEMSIEDLAAIGLVPNMAGADHDDDGIALVDPSPGGRSATKCDGKVCLMLVGTGLTMQQWITQATFTSADCTFASYWQGSTVLSTSGTICGEVGDVAQSAKAGMPRSFPNGTVLCNTWVGVSGKPCATVHS